MIENPESTLSTKTAASRPSTEVINLGNQLARELAVDSTCETLSKWMAHLLAEKITAFNNARPESEERRRFEQQAVDLTLRLWERRYSLPPRVSPFGRVQKLVAYFVSLQDQKTNAWPWVRSRNREESYWQKLADGIEAFSNQSRSLLMLTEAVLEVDGDPLEWEKENQRMLEFLELDALRLLKSWIERVDQMLGSDSDSKSSAIRSKEDKVRIAVAKIDELLHDLEAEISTFKVKVLEQTDSGSK